jgi:hypothetical protein
MKEYACKIEQAIESIIQQQLQANAIVWVGRERVYNRTSVVCLSNCPSSFARYLEIHGYRPLLRSNSFENYQICIKRRKTCGLQTRKCHKLKRADIIPIRGITIVLCERRMFLEHNEKHYIYQLKDDTTFYALLSVK